MFLFWFLEWRSAFCVKEQDFYRAKIKRYSSVKGRAENNRRLNMKKKKWLKISILAVAAGAVLAVVTRNSKKKYNKVK